MILTSAKLAPAEFLITSRTSEAIGAHCLEQAVLALKGELATTKFLELMDLDLFAIAGCGITCVIAKSFSFIFNRNLSALGLLGITITEESFYDLIQDGV